MVQPKTNCPSENLRTANSRFADGRLAWLVLATILGTWSARGQSLMDHFEARQSVNDPNGSIQANNRNATFQPFEPRHGGKVGGKSLWIEWVAPSSGVATFSTDGSNFDTLLSAYVIEAGNPENPVLDRLKEVVKSDDDDNQQTSQIQFGAIAGTAYQIAVDGFEGASGELKLSWDLVRSDNPPPVVLALPPDRALLAGDTVSLNIQVTGGDDLKIHWFFNETELDNAEGASLVIPNFQRQNVGRYRARLTADKVRFFTEPIELQINSEGEISSLARDKLLDADDSALVGRDDDDREEGAGVGKALARISSRTRSQARPAGPIGDTRGFNGSQVFGTLYAQSDAGEPIHCGVAGGASYWLAYQAPADGQLILDTDGSDFDTVLAVYASDGPLTGYGSLIALSCDNDSGSNGKTSKLSMGVQKGRQYYIVVDGVAGARGIAHLNYQLPTQPQGLQPTLTGEPVSSTVATGTQLTWVAQATGETPLTFIWRKGDAVVHVSTNQTWSLPNVGPLDSGTYRLEVTNRVGAILGTPFTLTVLDPPALISEPASSTVATGTQLTWVAQATGETPLTFVWRKGDAVVHVSTNQTWSLPNVGPLDSGTYRLEVTNRVGAILGTPFTLTVLDPPALISEPVSSTVATGTQLTWVAQATGETPLTFVWRKGDAVVHVSTNQTWSLPNVGPLDSGTYRLEVTNRVGAILGTPFTLTVLDPPALISEPVSSTVATGTQLTWVAQATGETPLTFIWRKGDAVVHVSTNQTWTLPSVGPLDSGTYRLEVTNRVGSILGTPFTLTVLDPPALISEPVSSTVATGTQVTWAALATGETSLTFIWRKGDAVVHVSTNQTWTLPSVGPLDSGTYRLEVTNRVGAILGTPFTLTVLDPPALISEPASSTVATGTQLTWAALATGETSLTFIWRKGDAVVHVSTNQTWTLPSVGPLDSGTYRLEVTNRVGAILGTPFTLTVLDPPALISQPVSSIVATGTQVTWATQATGEPPLTFVWRKGDVVVHVSTNQTWSLPNIGPLDSGTYRLEVTNRVGSILGTPFTLTVLDPPLVLGQSASLVVEAGTPIAFEPRLEGSEPLRYQWFRNGVPIERETQSTLRWTPMTPEDSGIYELHVSNPVGAARGPGIRLTLTFPASVRWIPETRELELTHPALTGQRFALQILRPLQAEIWQTLTTNIAGIHGIQHRHPVGETDSGFFRFLLLDTAPQRTAP